MRSPNNPADAGLVNRNADIVIDEFEARTARRKPHAWQLLILLGLICVAHRAGADDYRAEQLEGWTVRVSEDLRAGQPEATARALELLRQQLAGIARFVPEPALAKLREVPLWVSPQYPDAPPRAEYHPNAEWLREHGRDPAMARSVEFTNVHIFAKETNRMPFFVLHELAHAYHDRVLRFDHPEIVAAYERARAGGSYEAIERWHGNGRPNTRERAYGLSNAKEYFAETTEAFFGRNDFFPFTREELRRHDPEMERLLARLWGVAP